MKRLMFCVLMLIGLLGFAAKAEGGLKVVATNFPCYDFARQVLGDRGSATLLIHPGVEVHSYEPSPADILAIGGADLFVYVGGESDAWVESILSGFDAAGAPATLRMMEAVTPLEEEGEEGDHVHGDGPEYDEHIWTSPVNAMAMVGALSDALSELDADNAGKYAQAANGYIAQIAEIDAAFRAAVMAASSFFTSPQSMRE